MRILPNTIFCLAAALPLLVASCSHSDPRTQALIELRDEVENQLEELSAGDWIIIGPSQLISQAANTQRIEHLNVLATNVSTLRQTLDLMEQKGKQRNKPGNARLRTHMQELLTGRTHFYVDERVICMQLQALSPEKKVLFIHTDTTQQHSSVGIELDYAGESTVPTPTKTTKQPYRHADLIP